MSAIRSRVLFWTPRVVGIAFAAFLGVFAADAFTEPLDAAHKVLAVLMHLIPTLVVLAALALAWRREWIAAVIFPLLAVLHVTFASGRLHWSSYAVVDAPLLLIGALFLADWRRRRARLRAAGNGS